METPQLKITYISSRPLVQHAVHLTFLDADKKAVNSVGKASYIHLDNDKHFIPIDQLISIHKTQEHEKPTGCESNYIVERHNTDKMFLSVDYFVMHGNTIEYTQGDNTGYIFDIDFISAEALTYRI